MSKRQSLADAYIKMCDLIRQEAEEKLGRSLSPDELGTIYDAGSLMMLEAIGNAVTLKDKDDLLETFRTVKFPERIEETRNKFPKLLKKNFLDQPLDADLAERLKQLPYIYTMQRIIAKLESTPQSQRYEVLETLVNELI